MSNLTHKRKALIYCRVSSERQKNEGHGLDSQEKRCFDFAVANNLSVEKVFKDSFTGGGDFMQRPRMRDLLEYIDQHPHNEYTVIFDDLKRFARDTVFHIKLRQEFGARNVELKCLNFNFEDTPEGRFVETIMAAQGELEREQNKRQVIQRQKVRLEKGYWAFNPPPGYQSRKHSIHGKLLHKTELAPIIKEAFEGFESGRFNSQMDVLNFLKDRNFRGRGKPIYLETVKRLLTRPIYAGIIAYPDWEIKPIRGHHEPIISEQTFYNVQRILQEGRRVRTRKDISKDFPLRGLIKSEGANKPYTASYSTGRNNKYAFYRDTDKESKYYNKSFRKEVVEGAMKKLFSDIYVEDEVIEFTKVLMNDEWQKRQNNKSVEEHEIRKEIAHIQVEKDKVVERLLRTENEQVVRVYEGTLENLSLKLVSLENKLNSGAVSIDFGTALSKVLEYVKNPLKQWEQGDLEQKRMVVGTTFNGLAEYNPEKGFGTANLAPIYKVFEAISDSNSQNVEMAGIEPASK